MSYMYSQQYVPFNNNYPIQRYPNSPLQLMYPSPATQIRTPIGKSYIPPGVNAQINFYDPVTGRPGPVVNTHPQTRQVLTRPIGNTIDVEVNNNVKKGYLVPDINMYPNSNWKLHGDLLVHPSLSTTFDGSGVLVLEKNNDPNSNVLYTVILAQQPNDQFGDFGGMIDTFQPNSIENTLSFNAKYKILEESNGTFIVNSHLNVFPKIDVINDSNSNIYRCFLVGVDGDILKLNNSDLSNIFNQNLKYSKNSKIKSVSRFDLVQLLIDIKKQNYNNVVTTDLNNQQVTLSDRVVKIFKKIIDYPSLINTIFTDLYSSKLVKNTNGCESILI
jgi:hypothetical protein